MGIRRYLRREAHQRSLQLGQCIGEHDSRLELQVLVLQSCPGCADLGGESGEPTTTASWQLGCCAIGTSPARARFRQCLLRPSAEHDMADAGDLPKEGCVISVQRSRQCPAFSLVSSARWCPALSVLLLMQCPREHPLFRATQDCRNLFPYPGERTKMCLPSVCDSLPK